MALLEVPTSWQAIGVSLTILGEVKRVTFENEENGFRVVRLGQVSGLDGHTQITAVGVMPSVGPGTRVRVTGRLEDDAKHGERLRVESLVSVAPDTIKGLEKYLGSGAIRGVGAVFAKRIVKYFGLETLRVLDEEPHRLAEVPGLAAGRVEHVRSAWIEHRSLSNVLLALQSHGAPPALASKIVAQFGEKASEIVQQSPYRLAIEISGIGFKTADRIARSQGLPLDHPERAQAGVLHELRELASSGHCYCPRELLIERAGQMLSVPDAPVSAAIETLLVSEKLELEEDHLYLRTLFDAETEVAERVTQLLKAPAKPLNRWDSLLKEFEEKNSIELAPLQRRAVEAAATEKFVVITGGPGVGKTTQFWPSSPRKNYESNSRPRLAAQQSD